MLKLVINQAFLKGTQLTFIEFHGKMSLALSCSGFFFYMKSYFFYCLKIFKKYIQFFSRKKMYVPYIDSGFN